MSLETKPDNIVEIQSDFIRETMMCDTLTGTVATLRVLAGSTAE